LRCNKGGGENRPSELDWVEIGAGTKARRKGYGKEQSG